MFSEPKKPLAHTSELQLQTLHSKETHGVVHRILRDLIAELRADPKLQDHTFPSESVIEARINQVHIFQDPKELILFLQQKNPNLRIEPFTNAFLHTFGSFAYDTRELKSADDTEMPEFIAYVHRPDLPIPALGKAGTLLHELSHIAELICDVPVRGTDVQTIIKGSGLFLLSELLLSFTQFDHASERLALQGVLFLIWLVSILALSTQDPSEIRAYRNQFRISSQRPIE